MEEWQSRSVTWRQHKRSFRKALESDKDAQSAGSSYLQSLREIHSSHIDLSSCLAEELTNPAQLLQREVRVFWSLLVCT
jgi:hypothetical protein